MLATIIGIDVPARTASKVHEWIKQCVAQTNDDLIGARIYQDGSAFLVVKLQHHDIIPRHQVVLGPALQAGSITSFTFRICTLVKLLFNDEGSLHSVNTFPFREREFWFPAYDEPHSAYLSLQACELGHEQSQWLLEMVGQAQCGLATEGVPITTAQEEISS